MTEQENAKKLLPIIQAIAEGKQIEYQCGNTWFDVPLEDNDDLSEVCKDIIFNIYEYRIKPVKKHSIPYTIEQNCGENRVEGGVVSISGSVDTFRCWKCGRTLPISERTNFVYASNPPRYSCKECEGIKKEKQYRPFRSCDELVECWEQKMHLVYVKDTRNKLYRPAVWVKHKEYGTDFLITAFDNNNESIGANVIINDIGVTMKMLFDNYTFCDGSVCGVIE